MPDDPRDPSDVSLRDLFAGLALVECIRVAEHQTPEPHPLLTDLFDKAAGYAYYAADAMLRARSLPTTPQQP